MDYKKIIEEYKTIKKLSNNCKNKQTEAAKVLDQKIKESLQDKSFTEYSTYFSELFQVWSNMDEIKTDFNITPFDEQALDKKYKEYMATSSFPIYQKTKKEQTNDSSVHTNKRCRPKSSTNTIHWGVCWTHSM